jgi:hypothetical protein
MTRRPFHRALNSLVSFHKHGTNKSKVFQTKLKKDPATPAYRIVLCGNGSNVYTFRLRHPTTQKTLTVIVHEREVAKWTIREYPGKWTKEGDPIRNGHAKTKVEFEAVGESKYGKQRYRLLSLISPVKMWVMQKGVTAKPTDSWDIVSIRVRNDQAPYYNHLHYFCATLTSSAIGTYVLEEDYEFFQQQRAKEGIRKVEQRTATVDRSKMIEEGEKRMQEQYQAYLLQQHELGKSLFLFAK